MTTMWYNICMRTIKCIKCQREIIVVHPRGATKYCPTCAIIARQERDKHYRERKTTQAGLKCKSCGKQLSWHWGKHPEMCSKCWGNNHRGINSHAWKGGLSCFSGYMYRYCIEPHPRAMSHKRKGQPFYYVPEHILVWEETHNRPLPPDHTVHHLNGIKSDNRPENLVALPTKRHSSGLVNKALQKRVRELEAIIAQMRLQL